MTTQESWEQTTESLDLFTNPHNGEGFFVHPEVIAQAKELTQRLAHLNFPLPTVWSHGPKSVVLSWEHEGFSLSCTVTAVAGLAMVSWL